MNTATQTRPMGVALIGAGMIAQTQIAAISDLKEQLHLAAVLSRTPARAQPLADLYDGTAPLFTDDLAQITGDPDIVFAIVATPPQVRLQVIDPLVRAGKHILLEKPVARTTGEAEDVVALCEAAGVTLGVLFQHRMRADAKAAARHIASGALGKLGHVEIVAPLWRPQSYYDELGRGTYERDGGGVLLTQAIHTIDLALSLTGPVVAVQGMTATTPLHQMEAEDFAVAGLRFANGAVGSLVASTASFPQGQESITLHYQHGSLRLSKAGLVVSWRDGRVERDMATGADAAQPEATAPKHDLHRAVIADFAEAIAMQRPPMVTGQQALAAHRLIDAIVAASDTPPTTVARGSRTSL